MPLFSRWLNKRSCLDKITSYLCRGNNIFIPLTFIALVEMFLRPFFNGPQIIIMDWTNDIIYLSVFIFGFVFAFEPNIQDRITRLVKISKLVVITFIPIFVWIYYLWAVYHLDMVIISVAWAFMKGIYECSVIIFLLDIGKKYLNRESNLLIYLSKASFSYYYLHFLPVSAFTYYFISTKINVYFKYLSVVLLSYIFIFISYDLILRRLLGKFTRKVNFQPNQQNKIQ